MLATARLVDRLEEAIADRALVGATTAGTRRRLAREVSPEAFVAEAREASGGGLDAACLVFGNEKHGLGADDIERCHVAVRIATASGQPSMTLGQAVAVCCYEAARGLTLSAGAPARRERAATAGEVEALVVEATAAAARQAAARDRLRALLFRARATAPDVALLRGLLRRPSDNDTNGQSG